MIGVGLSSSAKNWKGDEAAGRIIRKIGRRSGAIDQGRPAYLLGIRVCKMPELKVLRNVMTEERRRCANVKAVEGRFPSYRQVQLWTVSH